MKLLEEKKQEHAPGYVISMWHLEDLLRASQFDIQRVKTLLVDQMEGDTSDKEEALKEYQAMMDRMKAQGLEEKGHLEEVLDVMAELQFLHDTLMGPLDNEAYKQVFAKAEPDIQELQRRMQGTPKREVETCLNGVYGVMLLRAKNTKISESTLNAEKDLRALLDLLSEHYRSARQFPKVSLN